MQNKFKISSLKFQINWLLILVILLFLVTRLYRVSEIPSSMYWDEASISYNAYSILRTGHDEWGQFLPIDFKAFGEYKLPVFIYSVVPFTAIFGPTEWAVRLPAVIFALASLIFIYLLAYETTGKKVVAIISSFFLSISPWFFIFSRTGYEATAGLMFYLFGLYCLLKIFRSNWWLIWATLSFIVSFYSYNSFRVIIPVTLLGFLIISIPLFKSKIKKILPSLLVSLILFVIMLLPVVNLLTAEDGTKRLNDVGIFNQGLGKRQLLATFSENFLSHFSPKFLLSGDINLRSQQAGFGQIYLIDIAFFLAGLFFILKKRERKYLLILFLLILGPIPASLTKESPHALRSISMLPFVLITTAIGVNYIANKFKARRFLLSSILLLYLILFGNYFYNFLSPYPIKSADSWQYGYKQIYQRYNSEFNNFDTIIISDMYSQPYIFALTYLNYNPEKFRAEVSYNTTIRKETSKVKSFGKFHFESIDFNGLPTGKNLIFASPNDRLTEIRPADEIKNPDGSVSFYVYQYEK